jgi:uncharacterized membrane protein YeaQ/YmgE (transglycosylase-associated protein family)
MGFVAWVFLGAISGMVARFLVGQSGGSCCGDIIVGIIGAVLGGVLFNSLGGRGVTGFNLYSLVVAVVGAAVFLLLLRVLHHAAGDNRRHPPPPQV